MIVVDSNIVAYLYLPGEYTAAAEALLEKEPSWAAPILWRCEFRNILAGYIRRGSLTLQQAHCLQCEAEDLLGGAEYEVDSLNILELARDSECSAYDCEFVALARKLGTKLVTMDGKLARLPLFAAVFADFCEPHARKRLIDMAWSSAESAKPAVVPTLPLA